MKRGKRQVIETPIFDSENQQQFAENVFSFNNNFNPSSWKPERQTTENQEQQNVNLKKNQLIDKPVTIIQQDLQPQKQNNLSKTNIVIGEDDDRKKRIQMLRQKYLKNSAAVQIKQEPPKKQSFQKSEQNKIPIVSKVQHSYQHKKQDVRVHSYWNKIHQPSFKQQKQNTNQQSRQYQQITNKEQSPISKPTQITQTIHIPQPRIPAPPIGGSRRKNPPPPPPKLPEIQPSSFKTQINPVQLNQNKQEQITQIPQNKPNTYKPAPKKQPSLINQYNSKDESTQEFKKQQSQNYKQNNSNFQQLIQKWLNNDIDDNKFQCNKNHIIELIVTQLSGNQTSKFVQGVITNFIVKNQKGYSDDQFKFILDSLTTELTQLSNFSKLFLSIKCGVTALQRYNKNILNKNQVQLFTQLIKIKQYINSKQLNQFIRFYLSNVKFCEQIIVLLVQLLPSCSALQEYLINYHFENKNNIPNILLQMRNKLEENMCPVYFKLINVSLLEINTQSILQAILKLINNIGFQSAYQFKKDTKLKIIQKIDKSSGQNIGSTFQVIKNQSTSQFKNPHSKESQKQKSLGVINIMGFVNNAFKKITSQIPQKQQQQGQQKSVNEQPTQKIQWDPVLKRYLINGKVPQEEGNNSYNPKQEAVEGQPKKKVPPPPPKIGKRSNQTPKEPIEQTVQTPNAQSQPQISQQNNNSSNIQQYFQKQKNQQFPVHPRMGLKGTTNKKNKIQARYT